MDANGANGNGARLSALEERIQTLKQKDAALRAQIAAITVKRKKHEFKEFEKEKNIVGGVVLAACKEDSDLKSRIKAAVQKAPLIESEKKLLRAKGWI